MKQLQRALLFILLNTLCFTLMAEGKNTSLTPINRIVAVVNQDIITEFDLSNAVQAAKKQLQQHKMQLPSNQVLRQKILDGLIYQKLQLQLAAQNKIAASDKQIDDAIASIAKQNNISVADLKEKLKQENITYATFKKQISDQIVINTLQQQVMSSKINITNKQLQAFKEKLAKKTAAEQYYVTDYLIALPEEASAVQKKQALTLAEDTIKALDHKKEIPSGVEKIDLGWRVIDAIPDLFATYVVKMQDNSTAGPILASNGYHVLQLIASKKDVQGISDDEARQLLYQKKYQKALTKWLEGLRKNSYVKIYSLP